MSDLLNRIRSGEILVGDGAMGTMLLRRGLVLGQCPEKWNLERPEVLTEIAALYAEAGSDIVSTNTFGGSALKLAQYDLGDKTEEINAAAVRAARQAVEDRAYVALSVGPIGHLLMPYGDIDPEEARSAFERQIIGATREGIDLICIETMTDLAEAKLAIEAARNIYPDTPVSCTMTFDVIPRGFFTIMGTTVERAANELAEVGADIVGSNCGNGIDNMVKIAEEFQRHTQLPLIIQSNAGLPEIRGDEAVYSETPEFMAKRCGMLLDCGVKILGGCCGTTPEHIRAFRQYVDAYSARA